LVGRDPAVVKDLWHQVEETGAFDLRATPYLRVSSILVSQREVARTRIVSRRFAVFGVTTAS